MPKTHSARVWVNEVVDLDGESETTLLDGLDDAIVGIIRLDCIRAVYDYEKIIKILMDRDGMSRDEAAEFYDVNIEPIGDLTGGPLFLEPKP